MRGIDLLVDATHMLLLMQGPTGMRVELSTTEPGQQADFHTGGGLNTAIQLYNAKVPCPQMADGRLDPQKCLNKNQERWPCGAMPVEHDATNHRGGGQKHQHDTAGTTFLRYQVQPNGIS